MADEINFTEKDFSDIKKQISDLFGGDTNITLRQKFLDIQTLVIQLRDQLRVSLASSLSRGQEHLAKLGYLTIMQIRKLLTGEEIIYELYMSNSSNSFVKVFRVNEEFLLEHSKLSGNSLRLKGVIQAAEKQQTKDDVYQNIINTHINKMMATLDTKTFSHTKDNRTYQARIVQSPFFEQYYPNLNSHIGYTKSDGQQLPIGFNMGNIMETADKVISKILLDNHQQKLMTSIDSSYIDVQHKFLLTLAKDNTPGFKGGDNGLAQVKARNASIMQVNTIINYLDQCNIILTAILQTGTTADNLSRLIQTTFIDKDNSMAQMATITANKVANEIIERLKMPSSSHLEYKVF